MANFTESYKFRLKLHTIFSVARAAVLCIILSGITSNLVSAQTYKQFTIQGSVVDGESLEGLTGVHVFVKFKYGTVTDIDGNFSLKVNYMDTVHLTRIGYDSYSIRLSDTLLTEGMIISMKKSARMLKGVTVEATFQASTIMQRSELQPMKIDGIPEVKLDEDSQYRLGVMGSISSPATALYRSFSKRYREEKKFRQIVKEQDRQQKIKEQTFANLRSVLEVNRTPLNEEEYEEFMEFCGLSEQRVYNSTEYDLILIVKECVERYHAYTYEKSLKDN